MAREVRILLKRSDISAGTLQVIDLLPNTSQLNNPYEPVGQSKYLRPPDTADADVSVSGSTTTFSAESKGLAAYFLVNVDAETGVAASGTVTAATVLAADTVTIGGIQFDAVAGARTPGSNDFDQSGTDTTTAADLAAAINDPLNGIGLSSTINVTASPSVAVVTITADAEGTDDNAITLTSSGATLTVSGATFTGGVDETALTPAEANTSKDDILANLVAFGDTSSAAVTMDLTAVNSEMADGTLTAAQHLDVLDILAGKEYIVPAGTTVVSSGSGDLTVTGGPGFTAGSLRVIYNTEAFLVSHSGGYLSTLLRTNYSFAEATGTNLEAVAVINDDGTLYTT